MANGSVAIEAALKALDVGPEDEVIVTPRSFMASVSSVVLVGATPVFADVDRDSGNLTAESIQQKISPRTKAVIVVHLAGWPADMEGILKVADRFGIKVIEDCAQAHGAKLNGRHLGTFGHVATWSFCQDKIITTLGEGGLLATRDTELFKRCWSLKDHGKSYDAVFHREHPPGFRWLHESFGTNWRMTEVQGAVGRRALAKLDGWVETRRRNADLYRDHLLDCPLVRIPELPENVYHAQYKFYVYLNPERLKVGWDRERLISEIVESGVPCFSGSCSEIYREKAFEETDFQPLERLPVTRELGETSLMFLVHPTLDAKTVQAAAETVRAKLDEALA
jgi:dTDP-4-amino-4,6-dideoxygalactose transaminase